MTCRLIEGFEGFPTASAVSENLMSAAGYYWVQAGPGIKMPSTTTGRFDYGNCLAIVDSGGISPQEHYVRLLSEETDSGVFGFAYKWSATNGDVQNFVSFYDAVNYGMSVQIRFKPMGVIEVWRSASVFLGKTAPGKFTPDQWFFCEVKTHIHPTAGSVQIRVNTVVVLDLVSVNTDGGGRGSIDAVSFGGLQQSGSAHYESYIDDIYFNDLEGDVNNDYLGNVRVKSQFTVSAGDLTQFSIGGSGPAPTNWQSVQNRLLTDAQYVYDLTTGHEDLYHIQAIVNSPLVHAVQVNAAYRMDDSTQRIARNLLKSGSTLVSGSDKYVNQTYTLYRDIWELNPDTGVSFTGSEVNAIQIGPKVQG